ncbi:MAG: sel1 repeat family protein [Deltaproteobacteria bacterium]|jgi:TPR repeat protein|nr:sel1 repeat family protein [Deltaproteobacteria bacterium]
MFKQTRKDKQTRKEKFMSTVKLILGFFRAAPCLAAEPKPFAVTLTAADDRSALDSALAKALGNAVNTLLPGEGQERREEVVKNNLPQDELDKILGEAKILDKVKKGGKHKYRISVPVDLEALGRALPEPTGPVKTDDGDADQKHPRERGSKLRWRRPRGGAARGKSPDHGLGDAEKRMLTKNARGGDAMAQFLLGAMLVSSGTPADLAEAAGWLRMAADQGMADAQSKLAALHFFGKGLPVNRDEAKRLAKLSLANNGPPETQVLLATILDEEALEERDPERKQELYALAAEHYRFALKKNVPGAGHGLGLLTAAGLGVRRDEAKAAALFERALKEGFPESGQELAFLLRDGRGVPKDYRRARVLFGRAAMTGQSRSMLALAGMLENGLGGPADMREAMKTYREAASCGEFEAHLRLARIYREGLSGRVRMDRSLLHYDEAADELPEAMFELGSIYFHGFEAPADYKRALRYLERADALRHAGARHLLGQMHAAGLGVKQDWDEAWRYFSLSAEQDDPDAQLALGDMCQEGLATAPDTSKALEWYARSAANGQPKALVRAGSIRLKEGEHHDPEAARDLLTRAAELGVSEAVRLLGEAGMPVPESARGLRDGVKTASATKPPDVGGVDYDDDDDDYYEYFVDNAEAEAEAEAEEEAEAEAKAKAEAETETEAEDDD